MLHCLHRCNCGCVTIIDFRSWRSLLLHDQTDGVVSFEHTSCGLMFRVRCAGYGTVEELLKEYSIPQEQYWVQLGKAYLDRVKASSGEEGVVRKVWNTNPNLPVYERGDKAGQDYDDWLLIKAAQVQSVQRCLTSQSSAVLVQHATSECTESLLRLED
jgi:hypothetical protein